MESTANTAQQLRLTEEEFELIKKKLGRTPNFNELCAFSGMWSEHCSYKNSIKWLKTLPREGGRMLVKAGEENAGLMDIGDGLGVVFKIESHNHPSAIEPFQGAATGVGGIHRDIFTMGARPIAALNSLRFGNLEEDKTQHLLAGIVHGIGHYGNCFGVPTVGGEIYFDACYHTNPLVNAMSVGIVKVGETVDWGMRIYLEKVPTRQENMKAWELLLSESQERMLLVAEKGREDEVTRIFEKWDLPCSVIGEVTDDGILRFYMQGELQAE